jgi:hypothetical protein
MAKEIHAKRHDNLVYDEGMKLRKSLKPAYDVEAKRFAAALIEAHSALCTMDQLARDLNAQGLGFYSVPCSLSTDAVFGSPRDKTSDFACLLRECVANGFLSKLPAELRS